MFRSSKTPLSSWRRNSLLFLLSQFVTGITSMIVQYGIIWYLTQESGSATVLGFATLLAMLPMVLLSPFVGTFVDRWNKKALLIVPDVIAAVVAIVLSTVGTLNSNFPLGMVFVSLTIRSLAQAFQMPTIQSIMPTIVPAEEITKVNGQLGMVQSATLIVSPALGALLYSLIPLTILILVDVLGAVLGIVLLMFIAIPNSKSVNGQEIHLLDDARFGLQRIGTVKGLWTMLLSCALFTFMFMPAASMYPLMTMGYFHGSVMQAGIVEVAWSVGSLLGGAIIGLFGTWKDRVIPVIAGMVVLGVSFALCALLPQTMTGFVLFTMLNVFAGMATAFPTTLIMAMMQQSFPPHELGRVFGVTMALAGAAGPIGLLFVGPLADRIGVEWIFTLSGFGSIVCAVLMAALPAARLYDVRLQQRLVVEGASTDEADTEPAQITDSSSRNSRDDRRPPSR